MGTATAASGPRRRIVPIACTLSSNEVPGRVAEWQAFVASAVEATEVGGTSAALRLAPTDEALLAAISLAEREKECCAFFEFAVAIETDGRWLRISVPDDAATALAMFVEAVSAPS